MIPLIDKNAPIIEIDTDTVSRQAVRDAVCEELDSIDHVPQWVFDRLTKKIENLPPSPTPSRPHDISKANFSCPICGAEMEVTVDEWDEGGAV